MITIDEYGRKRVVNKNWFWHNHGEYPLTGRVKRENGEPGNSM